MPSTRSVSSPRRRPAWILASAARIAAVDFRQAVRGQGRRCRSGSSVTRTSSSGAPCRSTRLVARHTAQPVGQRFGLAGGTGQAETPRAGGQGKRLPHNRPPPSVSKSGSRNAHWRIPAGASVTRIADPERPKLLDGPLGRDGFDQFDRNDRNAGRRGRRHHSAIFRGIVRRSVSIFVVTRASTPCAGSAPGNTVVIVAKILGDGRVLPAARWTQAPTCPPTGSPEAPASRGASLPEKQRVHARHSTCARTSWPGATRSPVPSTTIRAPARHGRSAQRPKDTSRARFAPPSGSILRPLPRKVPVAPRPMVSSSHHRPRPAHPFA